MSKDTQMTELMPAEVAPITPNIPRAVMVSPHQLRRQMQRDQEMREIINEYIKNNMVEGKDYGSIEVKKGTGIMSKPSLLKPGAEKFCGLFKIRPTFRKDAETWEMLGSEPGIIAYICELVDARGEIVGEGGGTAKVDVAGGDFEINKQAKIARKRAQVDAVLRTGALSDFFTQDMEDAPLNSATRTKLATDKQIKTIYETVSRLTGYEHTDDMDKWLAENAGGTPAQFSVKAASAVIGKLLDAEKKRKAHALVSNDEQLDEVYIDEGGDIDLEGLPY